MVKFIKFAEEAVESLFLPAELPINNRGEVVTDCQVVEEAN